MRPKSKMMVFWSSLEKIGFPPKTIFCLGKSTPNPSFSWQKIGFSRQNHPCPRKKLVLLLFPSHVFAREKLGFCAKTIFFLGKTKKCQKTILLDFGRIVSQKMHVLVFWSFVGKGWFSFPKPSFS